MKQRAFCGQFNIAEFRATIRIGEKDARADRARWNWIPEGKFVERVIDSRVSWSTA
ncbi:hypothetical protein PPGU19_058070 [Paraburkholderia sp. PGU19]|nr:hypothetical protein PPGU19_058070 [Paraburkholderia sp. PGU19]